MSKTACFPYQPLQDNQIRVLSLQRGKQEDPLRGFLMTLTGSDQDGLKVFENKFTALSYTWGDQTDPVTIALGWYKVPIGRNLASALAGVRMENRDCIIWIDAICIDQNDEIEKSRQIQLMPTIYELAAFTTIWLGEEFEGVDTAFAWFEHVQTLSGEATDSIEKIEALLNDDVGIQLGRLLELPYWRRAWILQEAVVCKRAFFMCGSYMVPHTYFMGLAGILNMFIDAGRIYEKTCSYSFLMPAGQDLLTWAQIRSGWLSCSCRGVNPMDLEYLIGLTYQRTQAKDPRDRFYALLSFATNEDWLALQPDYTLSREDVFLRATLHLIRKKSSLDILQMGENLCRYEADPSWLPGWDQGARSSKTRELMKQGDAAAGIPFSLLTSEDLRILKVNGISIGKVVSVVQFSSPNGRPTSMSMSRYEWFKMIDDFAALAATDPFRHPPVAMMQLGMPYSDRRCFFTTDTGHIGFGPDRVQQLDIVALIGGASTPICLSQIEGTYGKYRWVGAAFVYKAMRGELVREQIATHSGLKKFEIH